MQEQRQRSWAEPWKVKVVEPLRMMTREERECALERAGYNTFLLRSREVYIDLLTDSGTSAMSDRQWAGMMLGDEAYAGSDNYYHLEEAVRQYYGYQYVVPTHQGRGAEHLLSRMLIKPGDYIPGNMYFTTTRLHQELAGGCFVDVITPAAHEAANDAPFKGDFDLAALQSLIDDVGPDRIPYICAGATVNMRAVSRFQCKALGWFTTSLEHTGSGYSSMPRVPLRTLISSSNGKRDTLTRVSLPFCENSVRIVMVAR